MNHIIHDVDRDGWGSAAMLVAQLGPENCHLYPTRDKEVFGILRDINATVGDSIWVLDIPGPNSWYGFPVRNGIRMVWVDHHLNSWNTVSPSSVEAVLPKTRAATTTMSVLVTEKIVRIAGAMDFARSLCARGSKSEWALVFDGLTTMTPKFPVPISDLPMLLAGAAKGEAVPEVLKSIAATTRMENETVQRVLGDAKWEIGDSIAVAYIGDAHRIPLARYSMAAAALHPGKLRVLVHRSCRLYCGRDSQTFGLDLIQHFRQRGLDPKGHGYVCTVTLTKPRISTELDALRNAIGENRK